MLSTIAVNHINVVHYYWGTVQVSLRNKDNNWGTHYGFAKIRMLTWHSLLPLLLWWSIVYALQRDSFVRIDNTIKCKCPCTPSPWKFEGNATFIDIFFPGTEDGMFYMLLTSVAKKGSHLSIIMTLDGLDKVLYHRQTDSWFKSVCKVAK